MYPLFSRLRTVVLTVCGSAALFAHPMGNFSVSHYSRIEVAANRVNIDYVLDLAEIPTLELTQKWNAAAGAATTELEKHASQEAKQWVSNLKLTVDGKRLSPRLESTKLTISEGAGNMPVYRIASTLSVPGGPGKLEFQDLNYPERSGWKEIVVTASRGAKVESSSAPDTDRSRALTAYPEASIAPPQALTAQVVWISQAAIVSAPVTAREATAPAIEPIVPATSPPVSPATTPVIASAAPAAGGNIVRGDFLSQLMGRQEMTLGLILLGIGAAFILGGTHALSPGHGKTMVAAYLIGARGTF
ncbi:MAG TPA: hypothetical protein VMZ52_05685, partial [Bryobacteraceae bacterium]|nr:hypothetical protein [Bryobacteraceae bacterium]